MATKKAVKKKPAVKKTTKKESTVVRIDKQHFEKLLDEVAEKAVQKFKQEIGYVEPCRARFDQQPNFHGEAAIPVQQNILNEAHDIIYGDREQMYGDPGRNLRAIADYWTVHLRHKYGAPMELTTDDVCQMMISVKQARLLHNPGHHDSQVDTAGYQALMSRVQPF